MNQSTPWRQCVFCGQRPSRKNREHIVPMWLQNYAGNQKKAAQLLTPSGLVSMRWSALTSPSCVRCNDRFAELESLIKPIFLSMESGSILASEAFAMMHWMDKVRIGLWRFLLSRGKDDHRITPNFAIAERLGRADTLIRFFRYPTDAAGIGLYGTETNAFFLMPSAMAMIVRDLVILSVSAPAFVQCAVDMMEHVHTIHLPGRAVPYFASRATGRYRPEGLYELLRFSPDPVLMLRSSWNDLGFPTDVPCRASDDGIEVLDPSERLLVANISKPPEVVATTLAIEVMEIQRHLLQYYRFLELPPSFKKRLKRVYTELDFHLAARYLIHDALPTTLLPITRRTYVSWL